jgi:hypothetical protein
MIGFIKTVTIDKFCGVKNALLLSFDVYQNVKNIDRTTWNKLVEPNHLFLSLSYLETLENVLPKGLQPLYVICKENGQPVFITYLQLYSFTEEHFAIFNTDNAQSSVGGRVKKHFQDMVFSYLNCAKCKLLIVGNIVHTGAYSYVTTQPTKTMVYIDAIAKELRTQFDFDGVILKDMNYSNELDTIIKKNKFQHFYTQPNMVMPVAEHWFTKEDYINDLFPKYRKRASSTERKNNKVIQRTITAADIMTYDDQVYQLYEAVYNVSTTKINKVQPLYFSKMKKALGENYQIVGYFIDEKLVSFASYFIHKNVLEANFVGFDYTLNKEFKLYQTILYDYVQWSIEKGSKELSLGRTGLEIKSTVGAAPVQLPCYIRFENKAIHKIASPILKNIKEEKLEQRHPFKDI